MEVYINYPNPHISIHANNQCSQVRKRLKEGQRVVVISPRNLGEILCKFARREFRFSSGEDNDMWLDVSLDSPEQEEGLVYIVQALLGRHYSRLRRAPVEHHRC
jgi:hypothetical protein